MFTWSEIWLFLIFYYVILVFIAFDVLKDKLSLKSVEIHAAQRSYFQITIAMGLTNQSGDNSPFN